MSLMNSVFGGSYPGSQADYEEHLLQQHQQRLRRVDAAQQKQYAMNMAQNSMLGASGNAPRFNPNKSEAFQIPLSQAITLWKMKFGDTWYDAHQVRPDAGKDFYADVFDRIKKMGLFESTDGWYRLKEDA
jgi:hypothetical protein